MSDNPAPPVPDSRGSVRDRAGHHPGALPPRLRARRAFLRAGRPRTSAPPRRCCSGSTVTIAEAAPEEAAKIFPSALPVVALRARVRGEPGRPDPADAAATIESIARAVEFVAAGRAAAVVTNPIAKSVLYRAGFAHPGHTEFLGELARKNFAASGRPVMMIWSRELAVVPATIHVPLAQVPRFAQDRRSRRDRRDRRQALRRDFGIAAPRLAFRRPQPPRRRGRRHGPRGHRHHRAGGRAAVRARVSTPAGRLPADTMFHAEARKTYDAAICMYHDQALIPIKTLAFDSGVNVTLGLPFIRTSPDHGTAFIIAGTGRASETSLAEATGARRAHGARAPVSRASMNDDPPRELPPLREVVARHEPEREKIARPEFSVRPQSHRKNRPRRRPAGRGDHSRDRPRSRRPHPRPACARREKSDRGRARRTLSRRAGGSRGASIPAGWRYSPATRWRSIIRISSQSAAPSGPMRICANLPYNIGTPLAGGLAHPRTLAAVL